MLFMVVVVEIIMLYGYRDFIYAPNIAGSLGIGLDENDLPKLWPYSERSEYNSI